MTQYVSVQKKILLIDDQPEITTVVRSRLEHAGYEVEVANSGEEGLMKVSQYAPDLVILDVMMDDLTGYEVCAAIKSDHRDLPVIMLTSCIKIIDEHLGYACRADAYIRKPLSSVALLPEIEKQLKQGEDHENR